MDLQYCSAFMTEKTHSDQVKKVKQTLTSYVSSYFYLKLFASINTFLISSYAAEKKNIRLYFRDIIDHISTQAENKYIKALMNFILHFCNIEDEADVGLLLSPNTQKRLKLTVNLASM